jgi:hypothetical protein
MDNVTGTISKIIVTLSTNIEVTAVNTHRIIINFHKLPLDNRIALTPTQLKTPVSPKIATIIIIPKSNPIVLKSITSITKCKVSCGRIIPNSKLAITRINAPKIAIDVLWIISNDRIT